MKTDDLIDMLASGPDVRAEPANPMRTALPLAAGTAGSVVLMLASLGLRADLAPALAGGAFWTKFLFAAALTSSATFAVRRLAVPGGRVSGVPLWVGLPVFALWGIAVAVLWQAPPAARAALVWGSTWRVCPFLIALIALPVFAAVLAVLRQRAPTRLRLAGASAGLAAGALAALIYCLHCPETSPAFVGVWYVLGILIPTGAGAVIGPRVLGW
jgi:hypothetical protein